MVNAVAVGDEREYVVVEVVKEMERRPLERLLVVVKLVVGEEGEVRGRSYEHDERRRLRDGGPAGDDNGRPFLLELDAL